MRPGRDSSFVGVTLDFGVTPIFGVDTATVIPSAARNLVAGETLPLLSVVFRRTTTEANDNPGCAWYLKCYC